MVRSGQVRSSEMSRLRERCPQCGRQLINTRFDTTFRLDDGAERLCFGIPGGLCEDCHQLYIDPELIELLDLGDARCVFAIESDRVLQEEAWSSTGWRPRRPPAPPRRRPPPPPRGGRARRPAPATGDGVARRGPGGRCPPPGAVPPVVTPRRRAAARPPRGRPTSSPARPRTPAPRRPRAWHCRPAGRGRASPAPRSPAPTAGGDPRRPRA